MKLSKFLAVGQICLLMVGVLILIGCGVTCDNDGKCEIVMVRIGTTGYYSIGKYDDCKNSKCAVSSLNTGNVHGKAKELVENGGSRKCNCK